MTILKYSFPLAPPPSQPALRQSYPHPECRLDLETRWRRVPVDEDGALHLQSDADGAAIIISTDYVDTPDDQAQGIAEQCVSSRIDAIRGATDQPVQVLQQAVRPHASGAGLEMSFAVEIEGGLVHLFLGYVTARKILGFSMICQPGRQAAVALFNATVPGFRPRLP